jgi:hypothetical protein
MRFAIDTSLVAAIALLVAAGSAAAQNPMVKVHLLPADTVASLSWTSLASDPEGDGLQARLPDAKELSYAVDPKTDLVWFKVAVYAPLPERWFGINVAFDTDATPDNGMAWWGTNKIKFDRLASVYLFDAGDYWQGYVGMADSDSVGKGNISNLARDLKIVREERAIVVGIPRSTLGTASTVRVIATVGSMLANNDDIPSEGMVSVKLRP